MRKTWMSVIKTGLLILLLTPGCSFKTPEDPSAIQVRLEQPATTADIYSMLTASSLTQVSDLNCFGVNVYGGPNPSSTFCGQMTLGSFDGLSDSINTVFEPLIALGDGLVFQAFGTSGGSCTGGGSSELTSADTVFKIGEKVVNLSSNQSDVFIPVSLDNTTGFSCKSSPFAVYSDPFDYVAADLSGVSNWSVVTGGGCSGGQNFPLNGSGLDITTITNGGNCAVVAQSFDFSSKPFTRVRIAITTAVNPNAASMVIALGVTQGSTSASTGYGCNFAFTNSLTTDDFTLEVGTIASGFGTSMSPSSVGASTGSLGNSTPILQCDIQQDSDGTYRIVASILDSNENTLTSHSTTGLSAISGLDHAFLHVDPAGLNNFTTGVLDDFKVFKASNRQY